MSAEVPEELTAYLDGELEPAAARQVEERLKRDPAYRAELARLQNAWDLLDHLDRASAGVGFSKTTLEMVAVAAARDAHSSIRDWPLRALAIAAAGLLTATAAGFACGKWIWPDPNRALLSELPVLENIDLYDEGDSLEFLRRLEATRLFEPPLESGPLPPGPAPADHDLAERRAEVERMTPLEQQHLHRKQERFAKYSADQQQRMLGLHDGLERDPQGAELRQVMIRYHEWLDTLTIGVRDELIEMPLEEQIARVTKLKAEQTQVRQRELEEAPTEQDLKAVLAWLREIAPLHREGLLKDLSPARRQYIEQLDPPQQAQALFWLAVPRWHRGPKTQFPPAVLEQLPNLVGKLSPGAQLRLASASGDRQKQDLIVGWFQTAVRHRMEAVGLRQLLPPIEAKELQRFFREELSQQQREWLSPLVREKHSRVLLWMYFLPTDRLSQLRPGQPGWPAAGERGQQPGQRPRPGGKRAKGAAEK